MSFFDDTKNAGLLLLIVALLDLIFTLVAIFALDDYKDAEMWKKIVAIVGGVIGAAIYALLGMGIMKGKIAFQVGDFFSDVTSKYGVLVAIIAGMGCADLISGIFQIIAFGGTSIGTIIIAILLIVMAWFMVNGGKLAGNIIWIILLILFILGIVVSAIASLVLVGIPSLLLYILLTVFLFSPEVKDRMGM